MPKRKAIAYTAQKAGACAHHGSNGEEGKVGSEPFRRRPAGDSAELWRDWLGHGKCL